MNTTVFDYLETTFKPLSREIERPDNMINRLFNNLALPQTELGKDDYLLCMMYSYNEITRWEEWMYDEKPVWGFNTAYNNENKYCKNEIFKQIIGFDKSISHQFQCDLLNAVVEFKKLKYSDSRVILLVSIDDFEEDDHALYKFVENQAKREEVLKRKIIHIQLNFNKELIQQYRDNIANGEVNQTLIIKCINEYKEKLLQEKDSIDEKEYNLVSNTFGVLPYLIVKSTLVFTLSDIVTDGDSDYGAGGLFSIVTETNPHALYHQALVSDLITCRVLQYYQTISINRNREKYARAAIMSRNVSHNIGSHVMSYLKQELSSAIGLFSSHSQVLSELYPDNMGEKNKDFTTQKCEMPFLVGLGRFIGFLQERQDYIAAVSTGYMPFFVPINMKDVIFDELNPDLRYERHKYEKYSADNEDKPVNILLRYLAISEGYSRGLDNYKDIRIGFVSYDNDGKPNEPSWGKSSGDRSMNDLHKVSFGLPGGTIGRQAFFSIVENIVRNCVKHDKKFLYLDEENKKQSFDLIFDVVDGCLFDDENKQKFTDSGRVSDDENWNAICSSDDKNYLYVITATCNNLIDDDDLTIIRNAINDPFLSETGAESSNKGIKEMRISAAWIRGVQEEEKYCKVYNNANGGKTVSGKHAPLLMVEKTTRGTLRYLFCVKKTNHLVFLKSKGENEYSDKVLQQLENFCKNKKWVYETDYTELPEYVKHSEYIIVPTLDMYRHLRPYLSNRIIKCWNINDKQKLEMKDVLTRNDEKGIDKAIMKLCYGISEEPELFIWDNLSYEENKEKYKYDRIFLSKQEENSDSACYVYHTHHDTDFFTAFWCNRRNYKSIRCIEAITGNNSSDRLVRRESLDARWYFNNIHAMKTRIAIFDERLFKKIHKVQSSDINVQPSINSFIRQLKETPIVSSDLKKIIITGLQLKEEDKVQIQNSSMSDAIIRILEKYRTIRQSGFCSLYNKYRNVDVYTIDDFCDGQCSILGMLPSNTNEDVTAPWQWGDDEGKCKFGIVGTIKKNGNTIYITFGEEYKQWNTDNTNDSQCAYNCGEKYDYISIHQGLLDKIYKLFKSSRVDKAEITSCLHKNFMRNPEIIDKKCSDGNDYKYLVNFFIHSGRSKPSDVDMPQEQPFIQFSAIENAISDSKYSLVELLDYSCYKENR